MAAASEEVFAAIATGEGWCGWLTSSANIDPRSGRLPVRVGSFGPDHVDLVLEGAVLRCEEAAALREWDSGAGLSTVELTLQPRGDGCVVEVVDSG